MKNKTKKYKCEDCGETFRYVQNLRKHIKERHKIYKK